MGDQQATELYHQLQQEWSRTNRDDAHISSLLSQLKVQLATLGLLFPTNSEELDSTALSTARDILEIGAIHSLRTSDVPAFERYLSLLQSYYQDSSLTSKLSSSPSSQRDSITALNLLRLLSQNRIAEFHTVLETLEKSVIESKPVEWVLQLERSLMEGSYSKVWSLCRGGGGNSSQSQSSLPLAEFSYFTSTLLSTVRSEIAACDEKAYETLPLVDAKTLLFFENEEQVKEFAKSRNWYLSPTDNLLHFPSSPLHPSHLPKPTNGVPQSMATGGTPAGTSGEEEEEIGAELDRNKVVSATLLYAKELESIV
ncbi:proteasome regulatory particle lid subunit RPN12 [Sporobolomyces salmoneus]|uniref:proteasome regulatory particle lid subunit RPN12 n=1 Tax=Sporobolomyces salmoneus TaxID=183962 RepID=UPI003179DE32